MPMRLATPDVSLHDRIPSQDGAAWDRMADHPAATAAFIGVCQAHSPAGFRPGIVRLDRGDGVIAGAMLFSYDFRLDMPLGPAFHALGDWLMRVAPRLIRVPLVCLGSPLSDRCALLTDPALDDNGRRQAISAIIEGVLASAEESRADIIALKDLPATIAADAGVLLSERGFVRTASLPVAVLDLPFRSQDEYLASLSAKMRSDLRRKMRQSGADVQIDVQGNAERFERDIEALYAATRARSRADYGEFDALPPGFLTALLAAMGSAAKLVITRVGDRIAGFNVLLTHGRRAVAYKIGLDATLARQHNLYFLNWLWMVRHCIAGGYTELEMGQTTYGLKTRLGCRLEPSWIYFRHRSPAWNRLFKLVGPRVSFARMDPDLRQLSAS